MDELVPTPPPPTPGRETNGRFAAGNPGGPGGARRRANELRRAADEAVTPDMVRAVMRKAAMLALQGNLAAMRLLLDRTLGRAAEATLNEPLDIQPPKLRTAADCTAAVQKVTDAICQGSIDLQQGKVLLDAIATQCKLLEVTALEAQLAELERQAATVDLSARGR